MYTHFMRVFINSKVYLCTQNMYYTVKWFVDPKYRNESTKTTVWEKCVSVTLYLATFRFDAVRRYLRVVVQLIGKHATVPYYIL